MAPFIALVASFLLFRIIGLFGCALNRDVPCQCICGSRTIDDWRQSCGRPRCSGSEVSPIQVIAFLIYSYIK